MKRTPLQKKSKSENSLCKDKIQGLLRKLAIIRDGGCILAPFQGKNGIPRCSGFRQDGKLVLQYDHLNSRQHNVSYANIDLGVIVCKGHHGWKHFTDNNKKLYDQTIRGIIGEKRSILWDRVENDRKAYPMSSWEWQKIELMLRKQLETLEK